MIRAMRPYPPNSPPSSPRARSRRTGWCLAALAASFLVTGCYTTSAHRVGAYVLSERPGDNGEPKLELYAVEFWGVLPGDTNLSGGGVDLVPSAAFVGADSAPGASSRRSFLLLPPETADGPIRVAPLANADVVLHVTDDGAATEAELSALKVVAGRIGATGSGSGSSAAAANRLKDAALLDGLKRRLELERSLVEGRAMAAEAEKLSAAARTSVDALGAELESLLDRAEAAEGAAKAEEARRAASVAQLRFAGERERLAALDASVAEAEGVVAELEAKLASDGSIEMVRAALEGAPKTTSSKSGSTKKPTRKPAGRKPAPAKPAPSKGAKKP